MSSQELCAHWRRVRATKAEGARGSLLPLFLCGECFLKTIFRFSRPSVRPLRKPTTLVSVDFASPKLWGSETKYFFERLHPIISVDFAGVKKVPPFKLSIICKTSEARWFVSLIYAVLRKKMILVV